MRFYLVSSVMPPRFTGEYNGAHRWGLPGVHCPTCDVTWSDGGSCYPCVDLSGLVESARLEKAWLEEDYTEFERLRELVRPLVPPGAPLYPGTTFGPLRGTARGNFGQLIMQYDWELLVRREALERLEAEGVRGLKGCRAELRWRQKNAPELMSLQVEPRGLLHPDCLPPDREPPCTTCGREGLSLPKHLVLDGASLPEDRDVFRLANFLTVLIVTERFVDTVRRLGFEEVAFHEVPVRWAVAA